MYFWFQIIKKVFGGFLDAIAWLTRDSPVLYDGNYGTNVERLAIVKQAHFNFR